MYEQDILTQLTRIADALEQLLPVRTNPHPRQEYEGRFPDPKQPNRYVRDIEQITEQILENVYLSPKQRESIRQYVEAHPAVVGRAVHTANGNTGEFYGIPDMEPEQSAQTEQSEGREQAIQDVARELLNRIGAQRLSPDLVRGVVTEWERRVSASAPDDTQEVQSKAERSSQADTQGSQEVQSGASSHSQEVHQGPESHTQEVHGSPMHVNASLSAQKKKTGSAPTESPESAAGGRTAPRRACGASSPYEAGTHRCILGRNHAGLHMSLHAGRSYEWAEVRTEL